MGKRSTAQIRTAREKKKKPKQTQRGPQARNPADIKAGIDSSKQPVTTKGQMTGGENTRTTQEAGGRQEPQAKPSTIPALPLITPGILTPDAVTPGILAEEAQLEETIAPENFGRDVAIGTTAGALTIAGGAVALATAGTGALATISRAAAGQIPLKPIIKGGKIAVNTKNAAKTVSWFGRMMKNPSTLLGVIGSYPFAGFIKEESLQTLSFGVNTATKNKDIAGAEAALEMQRDILNPSAWAQILASVPYVNLVKELKDFYKAATLKTDIDAKTVQKLREKETQTQVPTSEDVKRTFIESQR